MCELAAKLQVRHNLLGQVLCFPNVQRKMCANLNAKQSAKRHPRDCQGSQCSHSDSGFQGARLAAGILLHLTAQALHKKCLVTPLIASSHTVACERCRRSLVALSAELYRSVCVVCDSGPAWPLRLGSNSMSNATVITEAQLEAMRAKVITANTAGCHLCVACP